ncbi:MAG TPA: TonB-dependent receptor [Vicinamibacterales bacterium]|nr:TonB-dependent receptor [Vicinamibacterales bacterium]
MPSSPSSVLSFSLLTLALASSTVFGAGSLSGVVVDRTGRPLPRAEVRALDAGGETSHTFADEAGRFEIAATPSSPGCRVSASLTGFEPAAVPCSDAPLTIVLEVAPIAETVVVTATRTEAPASQVGASVTTFTAEDLEERQQPLVADLLQTSPGVMVLRTGTPGSVTSLFVRGGESNYNKVLLDGIPLNEPGGTFNFGNVTTEGLERVEIVRGAQSALFGSDAMASVIQLVSKRADRRDPQPHVSGFVEGGSFGTSRGDASVSGASGRLDYALGAAGLTTDNQVPNDSYDNSTVFANVGITLDDRTTLRVIGRGEFERTGTPGQTAFERPDLDAFFKRHDGVAGVSFDQQATPTFRQRASYSVSLSNQQSTDLVADPPYTPSFGGAHAPFAFSDFTFDSLTKLQRHHASYQADWKLANDAAHGSQMLTLLADWDGERAELDDRLAGTTTSPSRDNFGWSIEHQALWPRVFVTAGGRIEKNASFGTAAVPRGSIAVIVHQGNAGPAVLGTTTVHANAGLGIKEPTLLQSFSLSPYFLGNPGLKPERARTAEVGVEQRFAADRVKITATWFDNEYRNLITTVTTDPVTFASEYFNIGLTRAHGLETALEVAPHRNLRGRLGYTYLDSVIVDSTSEFSPVLQAGQPLFRRPTHSGYALLTWHDTRLTIDLDGVFVGHYVDSDFVSLVPPLLVGGGFSTWNARGAYKLTAKLSATVAVDNLTNAIYMQPLGYPALERAWRGGLRVRF